MNDDIIIRTYGPGDPSRVCYLHMALYAKQYRFKGIFEHYVMKAMAEFIKDPTGGQLWVAEQSGSIVGSIAIVRDGDGAAQLRWFAVDDAAQGQGVGTKLIDTAMRFCSDCGYNKVYLWTIDMLHAARHLYKKYGFVPTESKENTEWTGSLLVEEKWEYTARAEDSDR